MVALRAECPPLDFLPPSNPALFGFLLLLPAGAEEERLPLSRDGGHSLDVLHHLLVPVPRNVEAPR